MELSENGTQSKKIRKLWNQWMKMAKKRVW